MVNPLLSWEYVSFEVGRIFYDRRNFCESKEFFILKVYTSNFQTAYLINLYHVLKKNAPQMIEHRWKCWSHKPFDMRISIWDMGGAKVSTFFVTSDLFISAAFRAATIAIKVCKTISMIRRIDWRALEVRARKPHFRLANVKKYEKITILRGICFGS